MDVDNQTFIPGRHKLEKGQLLNPDPSAYELLHTLEAPWPCLSFDILRDHLGTGKARKQYPATMYAVAGTQAARGHERDNEIIVMKMSKLSKMEKPDEESSDDDESDDDEQTDPVLETKAIKTGTCTNRIRAYQKQQLDSSKPRTTLTATMAENGNVFLHDISAHLTSFDTPGTAIPAQAAKPMHTITSHGREEGFAVDWSPVGSSHPEPRLLTGDTSGRIFSHTIDASGRVTSDTRAFTGHESSVEELQWSTSEPHVFASASADGTCRIWDLRSKARKPALSVKVSPTDVNVLSWSKQTSYLLASGADDGVWAVWDLRQWKPGASGSSQTKGGVLQSTPVASFNWHKEQITSVEWHPTDDSVVCVAAGDNTVTQWDVAVEHDDEESKYSADAKDVPPQLLFSHYQEQVKECHWHPQQPGVVMATGGTGFGYVSSGYLWEITRLTFHQGVQDYQRVGDKYQVVRSYRCCMSRIKS